MANDENKYDKKVGIKGEFLDVFKVIKENKEQNLNKDVYQITINKLTNSVKVTEHEDSVFHCIFSQGGKGASGDFINTYGVLGFRVAKAVGKDDEYLYSTLDPIRNYNIRLDEKTMADFWQQIQKQMKP